MKKIFVVYVALCASLLTTTAFARGGGMGSHEMSTMGGGAFGTSAAAPGTNSLGTALSSSGVGRGPMKGPLLGTSPAVDREEARVEKMMGSIAEDVQSSGFDEAADARRKKSTYASNRICRRRGYSRYSLQQLQPGHRFASRRHGQGDHGGGRVLGWRDRDSVRIARRPECP